MAADPKSSNTNAQLFSNGNILWTVPVSHKVSIINDLNVCNYFICTRFCARASPTATGHGARRCVTSASARGHTTALTLIFTSMTTWWAKREGDLSSVLKIMITSQVKMDLRQFGKYNQFKILKQDAIKEVTRYVRFQSTSCHPHVTWMYY